MAQQNSLVKTYFFPIILLSSILLGGLAGYLGGPTIRQLKPLGEIFLNLLFTAIVPLIFFSVASAITRINSAEKLAKIIFYMITVFLFTGVIAAIYAIFIVKIFPPAANIHLQLAFPSKIADINLTKQIVNIFTVSDFANLLIHENILALIIFSLLVGLASSTAKGETKIFVTFLHAGEAIFMRVFTLIMYYAPIGFFAYFSVLVSELGPKLMENYARIALIYYLAAFIYFICAFTCYAYLAGKMPAIKLFWRNVFLPFLTSIATCSSAASIPANLAATKKMGVAAEIYETAIPLGTIIHKEGSVIGGIFKIAFLFGIFHLQFSSLPVLFMALGVSLLVGTVMGAIPSGGLLGELLILNIYGFPSSALLIVAAISIIIDPLATMLNVTGNTISSMLIARLVEGKKWLRNSKL